MFVYCYFVYGEVCCFYSYFVCRLCLLLFDVYEACCFVLRRMKFELFCIVGFAFLWVVIWIVLAVMMLWVWLDWLCLTILLRCVYCCLRWCRCLLGLIFVYCIV